MKNRLYILIPAAALAAAALGFLIWKDCQNETEPGWFELDQALQKNYRPLEVSADSLQAGYNAFHGVKAADDSLAFKLISKPFIPTIEYGKFKSYFDLISERRFVTISGVSGSGNSTIVDRIAALIGRGDRRMNILCAPQYDLEYHKKYIGYFDGQNHFVKGALLRFWDKCKEAPKEKFVCMFENFDKINPETVFGPELWWKLDDPKFTVVFGKDTVAIPDNFYLVNVTHAIAGSRNELNDEHYRRFGGLVNLPVAKEELIMFLRGERVKLLKDRSKLKNGASDPKLDARIAALQDTHNVKRMVYFFDKVNSLIEQKYSRSHELGQWSQLRKLYLPADYPTLQNLFLTHVNAFQTPPELKKEDLAPIDYTIDHNGYVKNSYFFYKVYQFLVGLGILSDLGLTIVVGLLGAASGWFVVQKKHREMRGYMRGILNITEDFDAHKKDFETALRQLSEAKFAFDTLVEKQKINYTEAAFFYSFIDDKIRNVQVSHEVNVSFLRLADVFLEDGRLSDSEYRKLNQFIESIKNRIPPPQYIHYKSEIEKIYQDYGEREKQILADD